MGEAFGIDLGTTYSAISMFDRYNNRVTTADLSTISAGQKAVRSVVYFPGPGQRPVVGEAAWNARRMMPERVAVGMKRAMGTDFKFGPIDGKEYSPEEVSAEILKGLVRDANIFFGEDVKDVVITVPAWFTAQEANATKKAGELAGLKVLGLLTEPVATAIAYHVDKGLDTRNKYLLVYDLGGETCDVTLIHERDATIMIVAKAGDMHLGGVDWTRALADIVAEKVQQQFGIDIRADARNEAALLDNCEKAKCLLSKVLSTTIVADTQQHQVEVFRAEFEDRTAGLLLDSEMLLREVLEDAEKNHDLPRDQIEIVISGGATKMPMVREMIRRVTGRYPLLLRDPELLVSIGAAYWAHLVTGEPAHEMPQGTLPTLSSSKSSSSGEPIVEFIASSGGHVVSPERWRADPPRSVFANKATQAKKLIEQLYRERPETKVDGYDLALADIRKEAVTAYKAQDGAGWKDCFNRLVKLADAVDALLEPQGASADPAALLIALAKDLDTVRKMASDKGRLAQLSEYFDWAAASLRQIDPNTPDAMDNIRDWYIDKFQPLYEHTSWQQVRAYAGGGGGHCPCPLPELPFVPGGSADCVHFSVTSPPTVVQETPCIVSIWAHLAAQREQVIARAKEEAGEQKIRISSEGPVEVERGTVLTVRLHIQDLTVEPPEKTILWRGEIGKAGFAVTAPKGTAMGSKQGKAVILANGLSIATVLFIIEVGTQARAAVPIQAEERRYRTAFASYASEDRPAVFARIQGMKKAAPSLDVFVDVAALRSGEDWQARIRQEILSRDVLYLFWSRAASCSTWVDWEWRCCLRERGIDFIDPCPLASPQEAPPPPELAGKHFNDWTLAYMRSTKSAGHDA